jgi:DNA-binding Lrp family transcriptional regulator
MLSEVLDAVDAKILDLIQHDAGLSVAEIAERVGLSSSPCWRRIKRLEDAGVIQRRVTILTARNWASASRSIAPSSSACRPGQPRRL